jgi:hypothetical protein
MCFPQAAVLNERLLGALWTNRWQSLVLQTERHACRFGHDEFPRGQIHPLAWRGLFPPASFYEHVRESFFPA